MQSAVCKLCNVKFDKRLKKWFADPANLEQIKKRFTKALNRWCNMMPSGQYESKRFLRCKNHANVVVVQTINIYGGLAQLVYNKAIGLPKNLWGAGYQGNANEVYWH